MMIRMSVAAVAATMCVLGAAPVLGQSPASQGERPRPADASANQQSADEVVVQGCLARDTAAGGSNSTTFLLTHIETTPRGTAATGLSTSGDAPQATPAQGPTGQRNAHAAAMQGKDRTTDAPGADTVYRLTSASASVNLDAHLGHQVEVRGALGSADGSVTSTGARARGGSQAVQGGQMQAVGQTMQSGQGGQSGQSTQTPATNQPGRPLPPADGAAVEYRTLSVTSLRMIAASCGTSR